ncbi:MAG: T9SS type A sorting domain-containing protein, partial [Tannerella sp.]|nr:T9SS type A sorting domain-containing protein [Tannerella sp.]
VWDFDIAFDNDNRTYPVNNNYDWLCISTGSAANGMRDFVGRWLSDPALMAEIKKVYANYRDDKKLDADSLLKLVNDYASQMDASQQLNFKRWNIMNSYVHQNPEIRGSYHFEVENLKNFLRGRIAWMDRKLQYVPGVSNMTASEVSVYADNGALHVRHAEAVLITVFDISGRQILSVESSGGDYTLPRGLYFVRVGAPRGQNKTFKVML